MSEYTKITYPFTLTTCGPKFDLFFQDSDLVLFLASFLICFLDLR